MSYTEGSRRLSRRSLLRRAGLAGLAIVTAGCDFNPVATEIAKRLEPGQTVKFYPGIIYLPKGIRLNELAPNIPNNLIPGKAIDNPYPKYVDRPWVLTTRPSGLTMFAFVDNQSQSPGRILLIIQDPQKPDPNNPALFYTVRDGETIHTAAQASTRSFDLISNTGIPVRERGTSSRTKIARFPWETTEIYFRPLEDSRSARRMAVIMS